MARPNFAEGTQLWEETFGYSDGSMPDLGSAGSSSWDGPVATGDAARAWRIVSGAAQGPVAAGWAGQFTLKTDFGPGDYVFELTGVPDDGLQMLLELLATHEGEGGIDGYVVNINKIASANDRTRLQRWSNSGVAATHFDLTTIEWLATDTIGVRIQDDGKIQLMRLPSGGSWTQVGSDVTDTTYTSGRLMIESNSGNTAITRIAVFDNSDVVSGGGGTARKAMAMMMSGG